MKYPMRFCTGVRNLLCVAVVVAGACGSLSRVAAKDYSPFPDPDAGYVTDVANLLSSEQQEQLERWLLTTERSSGVEIVVVTIQSIKDYPGAPNRNIEEFARALFDAYGIGNMPKNNGVLLLVAAGDRQARIELGAGYRDARNRQATRIMRRTIIPRFREGKYAEGVIKGTRALMSEFGGVVLIPRWIRWALMGSIIVLIPVAISLFRNGKRGWGWVVAGLIIVLVLALVWLVRRTLEILPEGHHEPGGWAGFGGGFSGGGGATGSW